MPLLDFASHVKEIQYIPPRSILIFVDAITLAPHCCFLDNLYFGRFVVCEPVLTYLLNYLILILT